MANAHNLPPYDLEIEHVAQELVRQKAFPLITLETIPAMRKAMLALRPTDDDLRRDGKIDIEERKISGVNDTEQISLLICRPTISTTSNSNSSLPCVYYIHGGGMISGHNRFHIHFLLDWILEFKIVVVSIEYRLAPEHPHPAPSEDCYAGLVWISTHAEELGINLSHLTIVGPSAGAGLAAAVTLMARDRKGPALQGQVLLCPMLDDRNEMFSTYQFENTTLWNRQANLTGWTALLGDRRGTPEVSPYAAPSRAEDCSNLPPTFIDVSSTELFRDEAINYAQRIWHAGGIAELHVWPGGFHGFAFITPPVTLSKLALEAATNWYRRLLASHQA